MVDEGLELPEDERRMDGGSADAIAHSHRRRSGNEAVMAAPSSQALEPSLSDLIRAERS